MVELLSSLIKKIKATSVMMRNQNWWVSSKQGMDFAQLLASKTNM